MKIFSKRACNNIKVLFPILHLISIIFSSYSLSAETLGGDVANISDNANCDMECPSVCDKKISTASNQELRGNSEIFEKSIIGSIMAPQIEAYSARGREAEAKFEAKKKASEKQSCPGKVCEDPCKNSPMNKDASLNSHANIPTDSANRPSVANPSEKTELKKVSFFDFVPNADFFDTQGDLKKIMKETLRTMATAQEVNFIDHGTYLSCTDMKDCDSKMEGFSANQDLEGFNVRFTGDKIKFAGEISTKDHSIVLKWDSLKGGPQE